MKYRKFFTRLLAALLLLSLLAGCSSAPDDSSTTDPDQEPGGEYGDIIAFRPVDCGIQSQSSYDYPFTGMSFTLSSTLLERIDSREVFVYPWEDYTASYEIAYALLRFSTTSQAQRDEEGMSVDIFGWEAGLDKLGAIGVYRQELAGQLDELTACDIHQKIGESADGSYVYYISTSSQADASLAAELSATKLVISPMHTLDPSLGYSAFSTDRLDGIDNVGNFTTEDIFGNSYTQDMFREYDLTLVNVFATWCSPCVEEIPVLEQLCQAYAKQGIKFGVVAIVYDTKSGNGIDQGALEQAQTLYQRSAAQFPFLLPDDGSMNGRLVGIEAFPESFFVDSNGNIVSEPYIGANDQSGWTQIIDAELAKLGG